MGKIHFFLVFTGVLLMLFTVANGESSHSSCDVDISIYRGSSDWSTPHVKHRNDPIAIRGQINKLSCPDATETHSNIWILEEYNCIDGSISPGHDTILTDLETTHLWYTTPSSSNLQLPPYSLPIGCYRFTYGVLVPLKDEAEFRTDVYEFVSVKSTGLRVAIVPGHTTSLTLAVGQKLSLRPSELTVDLDQPSQTIVDATYKYYCRCEVGEAFESWPDTAELVALTQSEGSPDVGGCFGTGHGQLDYSEGTLLLQTSQMSADTTCEIVGEVVSDVGTRRANVSLLLTVVSGDPLPEVYITLSSGAHFYQDYLAHIFNPSEDVRAIASCVDGCDGGETYTWNVNYLDGGSFAAPEKGWEDYITGENTNTMFVDREILYFLPETSRLELTVRVTNAAGRSGLAKVELLINPPPRDGRCMRESTSTQYGPTVINCTDWVDEDGIVAYEYYMTVIDNHDAKLPVSTSGYSSSSTITPVACERITITVRVRDTLGAYTTYDVGNITIYHNIFDWENITFEDVSDLYTALRLTGDPMAITQRIIFDEIIYQMGNSFDVLQTLNETEFDIPKPKITILEMIHLLSSVSPLTIEDVYLIAIASRTLTRNCEGNTIEELSLLADIAEITWAFVEVNAASLDQSVIVDVADVQLTILGCLLESFASIEGALTDDEKEEFSSAVMATMDTISEILFNNKIPEEPATEVSTDYLTKSYQTIRNDPTQERSLENSAVSVSVPRNVKFLFNEDESGCTDDCNVVRCSILYTHSNAFNYGKQSDRLTAQVSVLTITFTTADNRTLIVRDTEGIVLQMPRKEDEEDEVADTSFNISSTNVTSRMHSVNNSNGEEVMFVSLETSSSESSTSESESTVSPLSPAVTTTRVSYAMLVGFGIYPNASVYDQVYVFSGEVVCEGKSPSFAPNLEGTIAVGKRAQIDVQQGLIFLRIYELSEDFHRDFLCDSHGTFVDNDDKLLPVVLSEYVMNFTGGYNLNVSLSSCMYFDFYTTSNAWSSEGCSVGPGSTALIAQMMTNHLTSFASTWIVPPTPLDFDYIFANAGFWQNPTIYIATIVIYVVFFLLFIWARRKDKKDLFKLGVTPLRCNPKHKYMYEIVVVTGKRTNSGTKSKVSFILSGDEGETDSVTFEDDKRPILERGNTDRFLLRVPRSLGIINYMRIWHDNSGKGRHQSWFMQYIAIRDVQTRERFFFVANQWFSVVEGDGQVDRLLPVAGREQMQNYSLVFESTAGKNLRDGHLWFSIFSRPAGSRFTAVQRVACSLLILWLNLLVNIMWYKSAPPASATKVTQLGPFAFSPAMISIGVQTTLIILPVTILVMQLFRKSQLRRKRPSRYAVAIDDNDIRETYRIDSASGERQGRFVETSSTEEIKIGDRKSPTSTSAVNLSIEPNSPENLKKKQPFLFPWWCIIIAWIISILSTLAATLFTVFYGIQLGDLETREWFTSTMVSFVTDVTVAQPIKVIVLAVVLAFLFKRPDVDDETDLEQDEEDYPLKKDEEWVHDFTDLSRPARATLKLPNSANMEEMRVHQLRVIEMHSIVKEIIMYIVFVVVLMFIGYASLDKHNFLMKDHLVDIIDSGNGKYTFSQIQTVSQFYRWLRTGFVPAVYPEYLYNGDIYTAIEEDNLFGDHQSYILGHGVIRQKRIKPESCRVGAKFSDIVPECNVGYSIFDEDTDDYDINWKALNQSNTSPIPPQYNYTDSDELDSYPFLGRHAFYAGGGYVTKLKNNYNDVMEQINELYEEAWIDKYTRAVFVEISCYNAHVNMFGAITFLLELLPSGGGLPYYRVDVIRLLTYDQPLDLARISCEVIYFLFIIYFIIKETAALRKQKARNYWVQFWNLAEWAIIVFSIATAAVYFIRLQAISEVSSGFKEYGGTYYVNLQYVAYWNEIYMYLLGWLVFIASLKFIKLLRFNRRISLLSTTIRAATKDLIHFALMFTIAFVAFINVFYLTFGSKLYDYATYITTMETLLTTMLNKFSFNDIYEANRIMGPLLFFIFMTYITFVLINVFLTIINLSFSVVKQDLLKQDNDYEILDFMVKYLKTMLGIQSGTKPANGQGQDGAMTSDAVDDLSYKVEQLLNYVAAAHFTDAPAFLKEFEQKQKEFARRKTGSIMTA